MKNRILGLVFGLLLGVTLDVAAFTSYNYFAPGGDISCVAPCTSQTVSASTVKASAFANPTGLVGLTATNGVATTATRSDGAPALDQGISPTWTGVHTFSGGPVFIPTFYSVGTCAAAANGSIITGCDSVPLTNSTAAGKYAYKNFVDATGVPGGLNLGALFFNRSTAVTAQEGIEIGNDVTQTVYGMTSSTFTGSPFGGVGPTGKQVFVNTPSNYPYCIGANASAGFCVSGTNTLTGQGPVAGAMVDMTPDTGTFTATYTGMTTTVTCTAFWARVGKIVVLTLCVASGTSNATTFTVTGLPSAIQIPVNSQFMPLPESEVVNNSVGQLGHAIEVGIPPTSGTVNLFLDGNINGWTALGTKGILSRLTVTYQLN